MPHSSNTDGSGPPGGAQPAGTGKGGEPEIDIQKLTEKVYQLMLADLRLERARGARAGRREGRR